MQRYNDKWNPTGRRSSGDEITIFLVANCAIVLVLISLALSSPSASEWISAAVQAEFVGDEISVTPTQIAQPAETMQVVRSN